MVTRKLGRPPAMDDSERRAQIMHAAESVFLQNGYSMSTMEDIAKECGISKKTLYRHFANKAEILGLLFKNFKATALPLTLEFSGAQDQRTSLLALFCDIARIAFSPRQLEFMRSAISEAPHNPRMASSFFEESMKNTQIFLASILQEFFGELFVGDEVETIADILIGGILVPLQLRCLLQAQEVDMDAIYKEIETRLDIVLRSIRIGERGVGQDEE